MSLAQRNYIFYSLIRITSKSSHDGHATDSKPTSELMLSAKYAWKKVMIFGTGMPELFDFLPEPSHVNRVN